MGATSASPGVARWRRGLVEAAIEDALHGPVRQVIEGDGAGAGRFESSRAEFVGELQNAHYRPQAIEGRSPSSRPMTSRVAGPISSARRRQLAGVASRPATFAGGK